jgi:hypothetical protein
VKTQSSGLVMAALVSTSFPWWRHHFGRPPCAAISQVGFNPALGDAKCLCSI